ncbi:MAG: alpha/beta fold hydrolase [Streptosporangiaceae bacterium]
MSEMSAVHLYTREVGSGTPLVLLHAFPLSQAMWLAQREALAPLCRVITPDIRGFGGSSLGDDEPSVDAMADDVAALLDDKGIDSAIVGGLSMGGYVTMAFLRRHPDRARGAILADTKAGAEPAAGRERRERIADAVLTGDKATVLFEEVLPGLVGMTTKQRRALVYGRIRGLVQAAPGPAVAWAQRAMARRVDSTDTLRSARVPTLVVVGDEDTLATVEDAQAMVDVLPDGKLAVIAKSGHLSAVEEPDGFNAVVGDFVASVAGAQA